MKSVMVVYCDTNERDFEETIPLKFVGERNKNLEISNDIHLIFSHGIYNLSQTYKNELISLGFILHNASKIYDDLKKKYSTCNRLNNYEKNTFLQWLVIDEFFAGDPIIDYDGDIVFNESPKIIAEKLSGKTFVMQGCPAFTVISNREWFNQYREALEEYFKDIEEYSKRAWEQRRGWEVTFKTRWSGSFFRPLLLHDQDLMSHLIHTGKLIQDSVENIMLCLQDYIYFENPLFIHMYDDNFPYTYIREKGIDYFEGIRVDGGDVLFKKKVLFWHMQNCFNFYLAKHIFRRKFLLGFPFGQLPLHLKARGWEDNLNKFMRRFLQHTTRLNVYNYFFKKNDFSGIFRKRVWWKDGVFN
jgi:hypothetical protein